MRGLEGPSGPLSGLEGPRLLPVLALLRDPDLVDSTEWAGVEIVGDVGGDAEVDSVDVASSRLANLRLTGRRIDGLHMVDVLVEDCESLGGERARGRLLRERAGQGALPRL